MLFSAYRQSFQFLTQPYLTLFCSLKAKNIGKKIVSFPALMAHLQDDMCFKLIQSILQLRNDSNKIKHLFKPPYNLRLFRKSKVLSNLAILSAITVTNLSEKQEMKQKFLKINQRIAF